MIRLRVYLTSGLYAFGVVLMGHNFKWPYWAGVGVWMTGLGVMGILRLADD